MPDDAGQSGDGAADQKGGEKTYTQQELDDKIAAVRKGVESDIEKKFADYEDLKKKADEYDKLAESKKSEEQKLLDRIEALETSDAEKAKALEEAEINRLRERVAASRGLTEAQAKRLQGSTLEELEADAIEVFGEPKPDDEEETEEKSSFGRPKETLTPGASRGDEEETPDYEKIADSVLSDNRL